MDSLRVGRWEDLPPGEWLDNDADGNHWFKDSWGNYWCSDGESYYNDTKTNIRSAPGQPNQPNIQPSNFIPQNNQYTSDDDGQEDGADGPKLTDSASYQVKNKSNQSSEYLTMFRNYHSNEKKRRYLKDKDGYHCACCGYFSPKGLTKNPKKDLNEHWKDTFHAREMFLIKMENLELRDSYNLSISYFDIQKYRLMTYEGNEFVNLGFILGMIASTSLLIGLFGDISLNAFFIWFFGGIVAFFLMIIPAYIQQMIQRKDDLWSKIAIIVPVVMLTVVSVIIKVVPIFS